MTARTTEGWDDFWTRVNGAGTETIRDVEIQVPTDVPLAMEQRLKALEDSESEDDIREMVGLLFGADVLGQWRDRGMGLMEFKVVLAWGMAHASGAKVSFQEAYDIVLAEEARGGKAPANRAQRRAASKTPSGGTGGRSRPTSSGSTGSAPRTSRA